MYLNKATIIGNLTRDPELKSLPSGNAVANMSVATNRVWKDANGNKQEDVEYHNVIAFGKTAELAAQYLFKGSQVLIEGRLQTRSWEDKEGKKNYRTEIVTDRLQFGSSPKGKNGDSRGVAAQKPVTPAPRSKDAGNAAKQDSQPVQGKGFEYPEEEINPDDIPF